MTNTDISAALRSAAATAGPAVVGIGRGWGRGSAVVVADGLALAALHGPPGWRRGRRHGPPGRGPFGRGHGPGPGAPRGRHHHQHEDVGEGGAISVVGPDGRAAEARVAGVDPRLGLTVLSLDTTGITPVPAAPATEAPGLGTPVIALGDPGGRGLRVTHGYVASAPRGLDGPGGRRVEGVGVEHTAPLPRGASGGPLLDLEGRLIGVNVLRPSPGLITAIWTGPDAAARAQAIARGEVPRPRTLGIAVAPARVAHRMRRAVGLPEVDGVLVRDVGEGSPAEAAGLAAGDLVTTAGGAPVGDVSDLAAAVDAAPDGVLELTVVRGTETRTVTVRLEEAVA